MTSDPSKTNTAVISVGSNIRPDEHIARARTEICRRHGMIAESRFVVTEPVGDPNQPAFTNGAWRIRTAMDEEALRGWLHALEEKLGRVRTANRNGPRTIDLDLAVWNGRIVHKDVHSRDFVKQAVLEVEPDLADQLK